MLNGKQFENTQTAILTAHFHQVKGIPQEEKNAQRKIADGKIKAAYEEFRQHLEHTYLPQGSQDAKDALWSYIWNKQSEQNETRTLAYSEMETIYAEVARIVNLA